MRIATKKKGREHGNVLRVSQHFWAMVSSNISSHFFPFIFSPSFFYIYKNIKNQTKKTDDNSPLNLPLPPSSAASRFKSSRRRTSSRDAPLSPEDEDALIREEIREEEMRAEPAIWEEV
jgi:hypothetical protein